MTPTDLLIHNLAVFICSKTSPLCSLHCAVVVLLYILFLNVLLWLVPKWLCLYALFQNGCACTLCSKMAMLVWFVPKWLSCTFYLIVFAASHLYALCIHSVSYNYSALKHCSCASSYNLQMSLHHFLKIK